MLIPRNHHLQMSSCLSGGGRAYAFELEIVRPPSPANTRASNASSSSSPSSTLSESSNSGLAIATRKPRTPRKRPNQTYNEAAALLSTAYPNLFSATPKTFAANSSSKLGKSQNDGSFASDGSSELFFPFRENDYSSTFLLAPERLASRFRPKFSAEKSSPCPSPREINSRPICSSGSSSSMELSGKYEEDFDAESILDEEVDEGGIDSIMGNLSVAVEDRNTATDAATCYGYPMGLGLGLELGFRIGRIRALRHADEGNWWNFPAVDMVELSPRFRKSVPAATATKKKMKKVEREKPEVVDSAAAFGAEKNEAKLLLKLNYDGVLSAWSDKGSPFSDEADGPGNDVAGRLAQIELFPESEGGVREARVLRYKEKRRTRLFSKKIRYQVRKVNADRRPRMKGRFVRRPNSKHGDYVEC